MNDFLLEYPALPPEYFECDHFDRLEFRRIINGKEWKHWKYWRKYTSYDLSLNFNWDRWN